MDIFAGKFIPKQQPTGLSYHLFASVCRVDAMAAPLSEKGVELERTLGFFQFNRDVDDEEVRTFKLCLYEIKA